MHIAISLYFDRAQCLIQRVCVFCVPARPCVRVPARVCLCVYVCVCPRARAPACGFTASQISLNAHCCKAAAECNLTLTLWLHHSFFFCCVCLVASYCNVANNDEHCPQFCFCFLCFCFSPKSATGLVVIWIRNVYLQRNVVVAHRDCCSHC